VKTPRSLVKIGLVTIFLITGFALITQFSAQAGTLAASYLYLSRIESGLAGTAGNTVEMVLAIDTSQTILTGGTVKIEFDDTEDTQWCRTAGTLTATGVGTGTQVVDGTGNWAIDSALPGTLVANCTQGAAGTLDTITITGVTQLTAGTTYGVKIVNGSAAGVLGTATAAGQHLVTVKVTQGATIDSKTFKIATVADDTVVVSATVSDVPAVSCSIGATTIDLGTLYPGGAYATASHTLTVSSTGVGGFYWAAYGKGNGSDAGLYKASATTDFLQSGTTATLDLTNPAIEGFGITVNPTGGGSVPTNFNYTPVGTFGTLDFGVAGAKLIWYKNSAQSTSINATVAYGAKALAGAQAGAYEEQVTFVCGGYY
jgi:hypothetical protein